MFYEVPVEYFDARMSSSEGNVEVATKVTKVKFEQIRTWHHGIILFKHVASGKTPGIIQVCIYTTMAGGGDAYLDRVEELAYTHGFPLHYLEVKLPPPNHHTALSMRVSTCSTVL